MGRCRLRALQRQHLCLRRCGCFVHQLRRRHEPRLLPDDYACRPPLGGRLCSVPTYHHDDGAPTTVHTTTAAGAIAVGRARHRQAVALPAFYSCSQHHPYLHHPWPHCFPAAIGPCMCRCRITQMRRHGPHALGCFLARPAPSHLGHGGVTSSRLPYQHCGALHCWPRLHMGEPQLNNTTT